MYLYDFELSLNFCGPSKFTSHENVVNELDPIHQMCREKIKILDIVFIPEFLIYSEWLGSELSVFFS